MAAFKELMGQFLLQISNFNSKRFWMTILIEIGLFKLITLTLIDPTFGVTTGIGVAAYWLNQNKARKDDKTDTITN